MRCAHEGPEWTPTEASGGTHALLYPGPAAGADATSALLWKAQGPLSKPLHVQAPGGGGGHRPEAEPQGWDQTHRVRFFPAAFCLQGLGSPSLSTYVLRMAVKVSPKISLIQYDRKKIEIIINFVSNKYEQCRTFSQQWFSISCPSSQSKVFASEETPVHASPTPLLIAHPSSGFPGAFAPADVPTGWQCLASTIPNLPESPPGGSHEAIERPDGLYSCLSSDPPSKNGRVSRTGASGAPPRSASGVASEYR